MEQEEPKTKLSFTDILEDPNPELIEKWLAEHLTNSLDGISEVCSALNNSFSGPLTPFINERYNNDENFQVLLTLQQHINEHFSNEIDQALEGSQKELLQFMHAVTILWKTALHGPQETPIFTENLVKNKLKSNSITDERVTAFLLDRIVVNILWPLHRERIDNLTIEEIESGLKRFVEQTFTDKSLNYFAKTYYSNYFKDDDERLEGLRDTHPNDEFSEGFTNYLIASRLQRDNPERVTLFLQALGSFLATNDRQRQISVLTRLMNSGVDEKGEDRNYSLRFDESNVLRRMTTLLDSLDPNTYGEQIINSVVNEIVEYMMYRIRRNNQQCSSCNRFHAEQPRFDIDDMNHLDEFDKSAKSHQRVSEIVGILQLIRDGETTICALENPILERWSNESTNPELVLSIYSLETCEPNQLLYGTLGCLLHAASNHLNDECAQFIVNGLRTQLTTRRDEFDNKHMKDFMNCILGIADKIANSERKLWREKLNQLIRLDLVKFLLSREIGVEQLVYAVELHRTMISNDNLHPNYEENFYQVFLFMEHIIDEFDNENQYPIELLNEFHSMRGTLHRGLTGYIEAITSDDETRVKQEETFGFTIERLEEIQAKLLPKDE